ncbi:uncharacterized protein DNG_04127 [Cephalotrichum gorgonifer]|uniref:Uncharacterized protein n=1 Tax=Cephalotrichum gorgonifer TaxID=2041049 RepID=A0AAE8SU87_9PEZI|nr:uncharacterized protein DNG_04127 [Cephalotrichum gorgonifer]
MCAARAALLSTLALASASILLEPSDVPVECARICGPVVELTSKCDLGAFSDTSTGDSVSSRVKRRKVEARGDGPARDHDKKRRRKRAVVTNAFGQIVTIPESLGGERVVTLTTVVTLTETPAPRTTQNGGQITTVPAGGAAPVSSVMTTTMTMVVLEDGDGGLGLPADPPLPTTTPVAVGNAADWNPVSGGDSLEEYAEVGQAAEVVANAERECVCKNNSFDVAVVAGLCSSCIWQAGYSRGSIKEVISQCNITEGTYTPDSDSLVDNVRVSAARPTLPPGANVTLISQSPPSPGMGSGFAGALAVGAACGFALLF